MNIVTHNSRFHSDEVFGCAALLLLYPDATITRTRDIEVITSADLVLDVGGIYDPALNRFDHHQEEGAGERPNGITYASFGLIWKHFGKKLVTSDKAWQIIEEKLVQPIDTLDATKNGMDKFTPKDPDAHPYFIQFAISAFNPTWKEGEDAIDAMFDKALNSAKEILQREIQQAEDLVEGEAFVRQAYENIQDKRILILDKNYPWFDVIKEWPEVLLVVRPNVQNKSWKIETIKRGPYSYIARLDLPASWGGKYGEDLVKVCGVADAVFCHRALFTAAAGSKEGAIALAKLAIDA